MILYYMLISFNYYIYYTIFKYYSSPEKIIYA